MDQSQTAVETLLLTFHLPLHHKNIGSWRGAFLEMAGRDIELLHNHNNREPSGRLNYDYPLVQYRANQGRAAVFAVNKGIDAIQQILLTKKWELNWEGKSTRLALIYEPEQQHQVLSFDAPQRYHLQNYLPLNADNYKLWQVCSSLSEKIQLLERIIRGHLLSCLWGLGWKGSEEIRINLQDVGQPQILSFKAQPMLSFDLIFDSNANLPSGLGLGKAVSTGFGILTHL